METIRSDELMTAQELAGHLAVKPETVLGWHRQGKIPGRRLSHKVVRFNLRDVLTALESPSAVNDGVKIDIARSIRDLTAPESPRTANGPEGDHES